MQQTEELSEPVHLMTTASKMVEWVLKKRKVRSVLVVATKMMSYMRLNLIDDYNQFMNSTDIADQLETPTGLIIGWEIQNGGGLFSSGQSVLYKLMLFKSTVRCMMMQRDRSGVWYQNNGVIMSLCMS